MPIVTCKCGKSFNARQADLDRGWGRFCSKSCAKRKQPIARRRRRLVDQSNEPVFCAECGGSEATAELIDVRLQGLILNRDQLVAWTSEAEVEQIEADADLRAIEVGYIEAPHNWQADERRAYQESTGFPFGGA